MRTADTRPWIGLSLAVVLALSSLALAADPAPDADPAWLKQIKQPTDWLTVGGDLRLRHEFIKNPFLVDSDPPGHTWSFNRYRARLWSTATPCEAVSLNARLTWEGRYWFEPESRDGFHNNEIVWDSLNARFKIGDPRKGAAVTATIGRQDIILGDGWLVLEGTPLDDSRTIYFDAARFTISVNQQLSADVIYVETRSDADSWLRPFNSDEGPIVEQNERGIILWVTYKPTRQTEIDGYFIWKDDDAVFVGGDDGDVYTVGARVVHDFNANLRGRVEGAYQFGKRRNAVLFPGGDGDLSAYGALGRLTYSFNDSLKNQIYLEGELLSGDDPGSKTNEQFDSLWGRWPQYSELYVYQATADGRIADVSNMARINLGWLCQPAPRMQFSVAYHAMFAPENPRGGAPGLSGSGSFKGQLFTAILSYQFNKHVSGHLWGEYFIPGDYYSDAPGALSSRQDPTMFLRAEIMIGL